MEIGSIYILYVGHYFVVYKRHWRNKSRHDNRVSNKLLYAVCNMFRFFWKWTVRKCKMCT